MRRRENPRRTQAALLLVGAALGILAAVLFDPTSGKRRRSVTVDRTAGAVRRSRRKLARRGRGAVARGVGWSRHARHLREERKDYDDVTLAQKVQTEIFRPADAPKGTVDVNVANGVVQLRGQVERPELIEELVRRAQKVQGVREVESLLHVST